MCQESCDNVEDLFVLKGSISYQQQPPQPWDGGTEGEWEGGSVEASSQQPFINDSPAFKQQWQALELIVLELSQEMKNNLEDI